MKNIAVYPGTFDPMTYGHIDLLERASCLFDQVIIAIATNPSKQPLFTLDERVNMATALVAHRSNVSVHGFDELLLDFAKKNQANVILRGLRAVADFDYEFQLASMNRVMGPKIETVFLMPAEKYMYISSSLVREIALLKGDVNGFVPQLVMEALHQKLKVR